MISFRKLISVATSAALLCSTVAAAAYPAPFVENGAANGAIVYGANAAQTDWSAAIDLQTDLNKGVSSTGTSTVTGGDSVKIERSSDKFNVADVATTVFVTAIEDNDMPTLLADGTYTDRNNSDYDFTQKIDLDAINLTHFADSDFNDKVPTIGFKLSSSTHVLNYTLDFTKDPLNNPDMETTDLTLMGKEYYVLTLPSSKTLTLLDSASDGTVNEGETLTMEGMDVSISYVSSTETRIAVDGEVTNSLAEGGTFKLNDGSYVGIRDIMYNAKDTGISSVELSIGKGKLELPANGTAIELNDVSVEEITSYLPDTSDNKLNKIVLSWTTDDEAFIAPGSDLVMPGFEAVKLSMGELVPSTEEAISVENDGGDSIKLTAPIKDGDASFNLLYANASGEFTGLGKASDERLVTGSGTTLLFNKTKGDEWFVASWNSSTEAESYLLQLTSIGSRDSANRTNVKNKVTGDEVCKDVIAAGTCTLGNVILTVNSVYDVGSDEWVNVSINAGGSFQRMYTDGGLEIFLPYNAANGSLTAAGSINVSTSITDAGHNYDSFYLYMAEEDKDGNLGKGSDVYFTLNDNTDGDLQVVTVTGASDAQEIGDTNDYESYVYSDLATKILHSTGGDQDTVAITYHGDQLAADVYVTSPEASVSGTGTDGNVVVVKDSEVSTVSNNNLVVVGGSCINMVAAKILGSDSPVCGDDFSDLTNVGPGQYLIKTVESPYNSGKVAMLVAGYNAEDTVDGTDKVKEGATSDIGTEQVYPMATA